MDIDLTPWRGRRVCIALSGGGDSVALFDWCVRHAAANSITLSAVHVEHGIRGSASQQDAAFINTLCARACVPLFCFAEDVPALAAAWGTGLEEAGRRVRYARFCKLLAEDRADVVFTAHHAGDNAESVLLNLFRGASLAGAGGIRAFLPAEELCARFAPEFLDPSAAPVLDPPAAPEFLAPAARLTTGAPPAAPVLDPPAAPEFLSAPFTDGAPADPSVFLRGGAPAAPAANVERSAPENSAPSGGGACGAAAEKGGESFIAAEGDKKISAAPVGGGAPSLAGKGVARPMLALPKAEVEAYLAARALTWRTDESNADTSFARNFVRAAVLAPAKQRFPAAEKHLYAFSRLAQEDEAFLSSLAAARLTRQEDGSFRIPQEAPRPLFFRACARAFRALGAEDASLSSFEAAASLLGARSGAERDLPCGVRAVREYGAVVLFRPAPAADYAYPFAEGEFACGAYTVRIEAGGVPKKERGLMRPLCFDAAALPQGCLLRPRRAGDTFTKFGGGTKKLKDWLIDQKIPRRLRDLPVIACGGTVYAVCGAEISEQVRPGENASPCTITIHRQGETQQCIPM